MLSASVNKFKPKKSSMKDQLILLANTLDESLLRQTVQISYYKYNKSELRKLYLAAESIQYIVPEHILQYIISFNNCQVLRFVSKTFLKLYELNIQQQNKKQRIAYDQLITSQIESRSIHKPNTWILDGERNELTAKERQSEINYKISNYDLQETIFGCQHGDTILLYPAHYAWLSLNSLLIPSSIKIQGQTDRDDEVVLEYGSITITAPTVMFENIGFKVRRGLYMNVENKNLFMHNCDINFSLTGLQCFGICNINILKCKFMGAEEWITNAAVYVDAECEQSIIINSCLFALCGSLDGYPAIVLDHAERKYVCINDNLFFRNYGLSIGRASDRYIHLESDGIWRNNCFNQPQSNVYPIINLR